jgi:hypothetical protein
MVDYNILEVIENHIFFKFKNLNQSENLDFKFMFKEDVYHQKFSSALYLNSIDFYSKYLELFANCGDLNFKFEIKDGVQNLTLSYVYFNHRTSDVQIIFIDEKLNFALNSTYELYFTVLNKLLEKLSEQSIYRIIEIELYYSFLVQAKENEEKIKQQQQELKTETQITKMLA